MRRALPELVVLHFGSRAESLGMGAEIPSMISIDPGLPRVQGVLVSEQR